MIFRDIEELFILLPVKTEVSIGFQYLNDILVLLGEDLGIFLQQLRIVLIENLKKSC